MYKMKLLLCYAGLMFICMSANAQLLNIKIGSDELVENAIKNAVVIVESNYCIENVETNQKYGRKGKSYFNILQFLGCRTDKGIIIGVDAIKPWEVDDLFDKYRNNNKYQPLLDSTLVVHSVLTDKGNAMDITSRLSFNNDSTLLCIHDSNNSLDGIMLSEDNNDAVNWIVWVKNPKGADLKCITDLEYTIVKKSLDFSEDENIVDIPNSSNSYVGGLYVSAKVIGVGLVEFSLSGFVVKNSEKWLVRPVNSNSFALIKNDIKEEVVAPDTNNTDNDLTPVTEKNKEKKKSKASKKK